MHKRIIRVGDFQLGQVEKDALFSVIQSGHLSEGPNVRQFETDFARYIGSKHSLAVSSGTAALIAGITALLYHPSNSIKKGSKVITTPLTYVATSNAIVLAGLVPVYVDVDPNTFCITPEKINACLEEIDDPDSTSMILPVHLMGYACEMDAINRIAKKHSLQVFEDSSQAHGTLYKGQKTGSLGRLSAFSFYIAHNIQAGEMGALNTNDTELLKLARKIKANGRVCDCTICTRSDGICPRLKVDDDLDPRFTHEYIGYNFKTMEFQAALAVTQLRKVDWILKKRQENVKFLNEGLAEFGILKLPKYDESVSYIAYPIVINQPKTMPRSKLTRLLREYGIETRPLFGSIPTQQPAYHHLRKEYEGKLPIADYLGKNAFYIGCHQYLTQEDLTYVISAFKEILN